MANKWGLKFPDKDDRARLRPSEISNKIAERGWLHKSDILVKIGAAYDCNSEQADALLVIAVQNGFVESEYRKRAGWRYRVVEPAAAGAEACEAMGYTRRGSNAVVGVDAETADEPESIF
jgi:hypothetical protein